MRGFRERIRGEPKVEKNPEELKLEQVSKKIFGEIINPQDLAVDLSIRTENTTIDAEIAPLFPKIESDSNGIALLFRINLTSPDGYDLGYLYLRFCKINQENPFLHIPERRFKKTAQGIGLATQCAIEYFCKKYGITVIKNTATSSHESVEKGGFIGAYVYARYGWDFDKPSEIIGLQSQLQAYAEERKISIPDDAQLDRPIDFARLKGTDRDGKSVDVGKKFLVNTNISWSGIRDLNDARGTQDFVDYLKKRDREDLIKEYYPEYVNEEE